MRWFRGALCAVVVGLALVPAPAVGDVLPERTQAQIDLGALDLLFQGPWGYDAKATYPARCPKTLKGYRCFLLFSYKPLGQHQTWETCDIREYVWKRGYRLVQADIDRCEYFSADDIESRGAAPARAVSEGGHQ